MPLTLDPLDRIFPALCTGDFMALPEGRYMNVRVFHAFEKLRARALQAGFSLDVASAFRDFSLQSRILLAKLDGTRPVLNEREEPMETGSLTLEEKVAAIGRFSALPGLSRHHLGTDLDVFSLSLLPQGQKLQLTAAEYSEGAYFAPLNAFLEEELSAHGFYRPYDGTGALGFEPWHISFKTEGGRLSEGFKLKAWENVIRERFPAIAAALIAYGRKHYRASLGLETCNLLSQS